MTTKDTIRNTGGRHLQDKEKQSPDSHRSKQRKTQNNGTKNAVHCDSERSTLP